MIPLRYGARNLLARPRSTTISILAVALVVTIFTSSEMLRNGISTTLRGSGRHDVALILRQGADAEVASVLPLSVVQAARARPEVSRSTDGVPRAAGEVVVVATLPRSNGSGWSNVQIRGVGSTSALPAAHLFLGRAAVPGSEEVIAGRSIVGRFEQLAMRGEVALGNRRAPVVGVFDSGHSSPFDSEVLADLTLVQQAFGREGLVSSVRAQLESPVLFEAFAEGVRASSPGIELEIVRESTYFGRQTDGLADLVTLLGLLIAGVFSAGAILGCIVTMQASVGHRRREIGTLRALGFSARAVAFSFLCEAFWVGLAGGLVGFALTAVVSRLELPMINTATWSELVFRLELRGTTVILAVLVAVVMAVLAGTVPALRAARVEAPLSLREE